MLKRAEQKDLISIILICLHIEETKAAINLHMFEFLFGLRFFGSAIPMIYVRISWGAGGGRERQPVISS